MTAPFRPLRAGSSQATSPSQIGGKAVQHERETEIFGQGQPTLYLHRVSTGAVRTVCISNGGRRQIREFYLPCDYFGLEIGDAHSLFAFAIGDAGIGGHQPAHDREACGTSEGRYSPTPSMKDDELTHLQTLLLNKTAAERIAWFLIRMTGRSETPKVPTLPMLRKDVAEHLCLTFETVSRMMKQMERVGLIKSFGGHRILTSEMKKLSRGLLRERNPYRDRKKADY